MTLSNGCRKFPTWSKFLWTNQGQNSFERTVGLFRGCSTDLSSAMCGKVRTPLQFAVACQSVNVISELPISAMKRLQCAFSNFITWLQNAWSSNRRQPRYSDPSCEISRKQRLGGRVSDRKTALSVPTSPFGCWLRPSVQDQTGGQLRQPRYTVSGWWRRSTTTSNEFLDCLQFKFIETLMPKAR